MTDGHTRRMLWSEGYTCSLNIQDRNQEFLKLKKYYLNSQPNSSHSCFKNGNNNSDENDWLVFLLSFGLKQTLSDPNQITDLKNGNRLIASAKLEENESPFSFPKSVTVIRNGVIAVSDTGNNRVIGLNSAGIQIFTFDHYNMKNETLPLSKPLSLCTFSKVFIAVANYDNSIINILTHLGINKLLFACQSKPIGLTSDLSNVLYVLTEKRTIECFIKTGQRIKTIQINVNKFPFFSLISCHDEKNEIYLSESHSNEIFVIDKNGLVLRKMKLNLPESGLNVFISNMFYFRNKILISDSVNRSVFLFDSETGDFDEMLLNGKSGLGCIQAVTMSNDNKLITTEYSLNQPHAVKIFSCSSKLLSKD